MPEKWDNEMMRVLLENSKFLMTSGAPAEMNPQAIAWYQTFEQMGWKSHGMALNDANEAKKIGEAMK